MALTPNNAENVEEKSRHLEKRPFQLSCSTTLQTARKNTVTGRAAFQKNSSSASLPSRGTTAIVVAVWVLIVILTITGVVVVSITAVTVQARPQASEARAGAFAVTVLITSHFVLIIVAAALLQSSHPASAANQIRACNARVYTSIYIWQPPPPITYIVGGWVQNRGGGAGSNPGIQDPWIQGSRNPGSGSLDPGVLDL